jgi:hypothetical protein
MNAFGIPGAHRFARLISLVVVLLAWWIGPQKAVSQPAVNLDPRVAVGICQGRDGTLLTRANDERPPEPVTAGDTVFSRDELLALPGMRARIESPSHGATLTLAGNLPALSSFPGLESAVVLHDSRAFEFDVTLRHGRILFKNVRKEGAAKVWVRLPTEAWQLTLPQPGDEVAVEMYGRWPRGVAFSKKPKQGDVPTRLVALLVLSGRVELKIGGTQQSLSAPPGAAYFHWDSIAGPDQGPEPRDSLPPWAGPKAETLPGAKAVAAVADKYLAMLKERRPDAALRQLLTDADKDTSKERAILTREFAVAGLAALGDLGQVADALADARHVDARENAVVALRNWIGAAPDRDMPLYRVFTDVQGYTGAEAATVLELLHSPFVAEQPETYETLIDYLNHKKLAVRELARWHLYHLAPVGREIKYDAAASTEDRAKAAREWKDLIPTGKLPPKEKKKG